MSLRDFDSFSRVKDIFGYLRGRYRYSLSSSHPTSTTFAGDYIIEIFILIMHLIHYILL